MKKFINSLIKVVGENDDVLSLTVMFKDLTDSKDIYKSLITVPTANYTLLNNSFEFNPLILEKSNGLISLTMKICMNLNYQLYYKIF